MDSKIVITKKDCNPKKLNYIFPKFSQNSRIAVNGLLVVVLAGHITQVYSDCQGKKHSME